MNPAVDMSATLLTPRGRGAVATILFRGDVRVLDDSPALFRAAGGWPISQLAVGRIVYGRWARQDSGGGGLAHGASEIEATIEPAAPAEDVVVCRTSDRETEIHCHGGDAASRRIRTDLEARGVSLVDLSSGQAWTRRRLEADCLDVAARTTTARTADIALEQAAGALRREIAEIADLVAHSPEAITDAAVRLGALLRWSDLGTRLADPRRVALVGRPNVGKSSLMNALVGHARSIVRDRPGTTRDVVTAETAFEGWPLCLADTAGLRDGGEEIEVEGIARARREAARADLVILVVDLSAVPAPDDLGEEGRLACDHAAVLVVGQKGDLPRGRGDSEPRPMWDVSARTNAGVESLLREIVRRLFPETPPPGAAVPVTAHQVESLRIAWDAAERNRPRELLDALGRLLDETDDGRAT